MKKQVLIFLTVFTILSTLAEEPTITNNPSVINLIVFDSLSAT